MERIIDGVQQRADAMWAYLDSIDTGVPLGQETVTDEEWLAAFDAEEKKYPPQLYVHKDTGIQFIASAFTLALSFCDNGPEMLARAKKLRGN